MLPKILFFISIVTISLQSKAQFMRFDPIPFVPNPQLPPINYQSNPGLPPPTNNSYRKPVQTILSSYKILSATVNGIDLSQRYISLNAIIAFYSVSSNVTNYMAISMPGSNSQSYGEIIAPTGRETPATGSDYRTTTIEFTWSFINTDDGKTGLATVTLTKQYRSDVTLFDLNIKANNGVVCDFSGSKIQ